MDAAEMLAEMLRKPDAQLLVEWIDEQLANFYMSDEDPEHVRGIRAVIRAYYEGLEGS